mmetsp:Transcript_3325/g.5634  ORF Transcript_3325/g.5634 Transcript_3325/m.5634 type:complete len:82 (+) Transcript_3325:301-546(+)
MLCSMNSSRLPFKKQEPPQKKPKNKKQQQQQQQAKKKKKNESDDGNGGSVQEIIPELNDGWIASNSSWDGGMGTLDCYQGN